MGRGFTDDEGLDDALRQMLPSRLAREAFAAQIARTIDAPAIVEAEVEATALPEEIAPAATPEETTEEVAPAQADDVVPVLVAATTVAPPTPEPPVEPVPLVAAEAPPAAPVAEIAAAPAGISLADALKALDGMLHEIDDQLPVLARKCAERQRLNLLAWICRARAYEEALPEARPVLSAVQRIARRLSEIGKMLWPGSVRALQLATTPADTMEPHAGDIPPTTWAQAAERAEARRAEHTLKTTAAGFDEDGWIDITPIVPPLPEPDAVLTHTLAEMDALLARLGDALPEEADLTAVLRIAQTLRLVRKSARDHLAWGLAIGRLRRLSLALGTTGAALRRTLDPTVRPVASWAPTPAVHSDAPSQQESSAKLVAELAELGSGEDTLFPWLLRAFDAFPTPALADMLRARRTQVMGYAEIAATYEDRRIRRRLRDLIQRLTSGKVEDAPPSARREVRPAEDESEPESGDDSVLQRLCDHVRPHTEGRRVLFASNRVDERLEARLTELLGVRMTGCDGSPRRVKSQCERIAQGSYDLVLSATGFQDHAVDGALARATNAAGIPYVRVNRGRPLACAQAIARELGKTAVVPLDPPSRAAARVG